MKLNFNLKNKAIDVDAKVEDVIIKGMELNAKKTPKKTRFEIKQEEKRKNEELKHKHKMQQTYLLIGVFAFLLVIILIMAYLEK